MSALMLIPILGICALALDLAMVYNRKAEMHSLAKAVAVSAARRLNGTATGIDNALADAASSAGATWIKNHTEAITWSTAALKFGTTPSPDGQWVSAAAASSMAPSIRYVRVDTNELTGIGTVSTALASVLSDKLATIKTRSDVIAGRTGIAVAPLAICAMNVPATARSNPGGNVELVEYGFRRGVSYDLMNLNPKGGTPLNYVVNPLAGPGTAGNPADFATSTVGPYVCSGSLAIPGITGGTLSVQKPFPLASLYTQLNSRFDQYVGGTCTFNAAPPDANIKPYDYTGMVTPLLWMNTQPDGQTAATLAAPNRLETIADPLPAAGTAAKFGPLWAYAKAVPYSAYTASPVEPVNGYSTMATTAWTYLYGGQVAKSTYPPSTPYKSGAGVNLVKPSAAHGPGVKNRRVLNVPLLDCSATPSSSANVLAVGKFFMMVPATPTTVEAEFAGIVPIDRISGTTGLFQ